MPFFDRLLNKADLWRIKIYNLNIINLQQTKFFETKKSHKTYTRIIYIPYENRIKSRVKKKF